MPIKNSNELTDRLIQIVSTYHQKHGCYALRQPLLTIEDLRRVPADEAIDVARRVLDAYKDVDRRLRLDVEDLLSGPCDPDGNSFSPEPDHEFRWDARIAEYRCVWCGLEPFSGLNDKDRDEADKARAEAQSLMDTYQRGFDAGRDATVAVMPDEIRSLVANGEISLPVVENHGMDGTDDGRAPLWP